MESPGGVRCSYWDYSGCEGTPYCPPRCPRFIDTEDVPMLVRHYEDEDFDAVVAMYEELEATNTTMGLPPNDTDAVRNWVRTLVEDGWNKIALDRETIVGHIGVAPAASANPQFVVFVQDDYQNRGIGSELVKHAVATAADRGHDALTLDVAKDNHQAITVYRNIGFEIAGREVVEIAMRLPLEDPVADRVQRPPAER